MKVKIKKNAYVFVGNYNSNGLREVLKKLEGKWLEVETDHLFNDQYNIKEPSIRVYDSMIDEVKDDERAGKGKCGYCGKMLNTGEICEKHEDCKKYGIKWFTPENTYFLKYPKGIKCYPHEFLSIDPFNIKIGSYYLECFPSLDYFRLYNCRQTINFKYDGKDFYIHGGIGYKKDVPNVPSAVLNELKHKLYAINKKMEKEEGKGFFNA
jgi:hypothetical protein